MKFVTRKELKERLEKKNMWCTWFKLKLREYYQADHYALTNLSNGKLRISYGSCMYFVDDNIEFSELINVLKDIQKGYKCYANVDVNEIVMEDFYA